jgi:hypothetical protein
MGYPPASSQGMTFMPWVRERCDKAHCNLVGPLSKSWLRGLDLNQRSRTRDYEPMGLFAPGKLVRSKPVSRKNPRPDF